MGLDDKTKNKAQDLAGKAKEKVGEATGNDDLRAEGQKDQAKGNVKEGVENVKDAFRD